MLFNFVSCSIRVGRLLLHVLSTLESGHSSSVTVGATRPWQKSGNTDDFILLFGWSLQEPLDTRDNAHRYMYPRMAATTGTERLSSTSWLIGRDSAMVATPAMAAMTGKISQRSTVRKPSFTKSSTRTDAMARLPARRRHSRHMEEAN